MRNNDFIVKVNCITYNHTKYITDAMDGFIEQDTHFPYVCCIIDDASTDGNQQIIKSYLEENFEKNNHEYRFENNETHQLIFARHKANLNCFFAVILLKENHYKKKIPKHKYIQEWSDVSRYTAICEGDDYWTDPLKLQKQVDFLESHTNYSMCFHNALRRDATTGTILGEFSYYGDNKTFSISEMILLGGGAAVTCSIMFRSHLMNNYPSFFRDVPMGDYPLQIYLSLKGEIKYLNRIMSVYRVNSPGSWTVRVQKSTSIASQYKNMLSTINYLENLDRYTNYNFHGTCEKMINQLKKDLFISKCIRKKIKEIKPENINDRINIFLIKFRLFKLKEFLINSLHLRNRKSISC